MSSRARFDEWAFTNQVDKAMATVKRLLANARAPELPTEVAHSYDDKFALAESLTNTAASATTNVLAELGIGAPELAVLWQWTADGHEVTLRLETAEKITFVKEAIRTVESPKVTQVTKKSGKAEKTKTTSVITEVTEYFWDYAVTTKLVAFKGAAPDDSAVTAFTSTGNAEIMTKTNRMPRTVTSAGGHQPAESWRPLQAQEVSLTWLLQLLAEQGADQGLQLAFKIDRTAASCRTPRRNDEIDAALEAMQRLQNFAQGCQSITGRWLQIGLDDDAYHTLLLSWQGSDIFVPVVPLFEAEGNGVAAAPAPAAPSEAGTGVTITGLHVGESTVGLALSDINLFLGEHRRAIAAKRVELSRSLPAEGFGSAAVVTFCAMVENLSAIVAQHRQAVTYVEHMLEQQLYAAIGRDINPESFYQFIKSHQQKLYADQYAPQPFSYAIRRPGCFPEGIIAIEALAAGDTPTEPVSTIVRKIDAGPDMSIKLNASCTITLKGERYLHAYLAQSFGGGDISHLRLVARARQFSAFILVLGKLGGASSFQPKHAVVIKDKDDLAIPLMLEALPSAKEFKDAIESLSPEQQEFAKAYRAMQLEGTVFGLAVVQLKPQLERLLNLPAGALTKEIQLSRDLQTLFIEHQIPSDLLTYDGNPDAPVGTKLDQVKGHVTAINEMITAEKTAEQAAAMQEFQTNNPDRGDENLFISDCLGGWDNIADDGDEAVEYEAVEHTLRSRSARRKSLLYKQPSRSVPRSMPRSMRSVERITPMTAMAAMPMPPPPTMAGAPPPPTKFRDARDIALDAFDIPIPNEVGAKGTADAPPQYEAPVAGGPGDVTSALDFTQIPLALDKQYEALDTNGALRPTKIIVQDDWTLESRKGLLGKPTKERLNEDSRNGHKAQAFDLLDAISRSGTLAIEDCCALHVMVAATHQFEKSIVNTVVQNNENPINMVERSSLIIAGTIHGAAVDQLVQPQQLPRIASHSAQLLIRTVVGSDDMVSTSDV